MRTLIIIITLIILNGCTTHKPLERGYNDVTRNEMIWHGHHVKK